MGGFQLAKLERAKTAISPKTTPGIADNWAGGNGGQFVCAIGFAKGAVRKV